jgi:HEAT repeat protein
VKSTPESALILAIVLSLSAMPACLAQADSLESGVRTGVDKVALDKCLAQVPDPQRAALVARLLPYLKSPDWSQRASAAYVLGCLGPTAAPAAGALIKAMDTQMSNVAWEVIPALGKIGSGAVPPLIEELKACAANGDKLNLRMINAVKAAGALGSRGKGAAQYVVPFLHDGVNTGAVGALIAMGPDCLPSVCKGLDTEDRHIPVYAATVFSKLEPASTKQLAAFAGSASQRGRKNAAYVFAHMKPPAGVAAAPVLCRMLSDSDHDVVENATTALKAMGPGVVPDVSEVLSSSNATARDAATDILR